MSTDFVSRTTSELAFVRWAGGPGCRYEFGTISNFECVARAMRGGETFTPTGLPMPGDPTDIASLEALVVDGRATFGQYPVVVSLGTGEWMRFTEEADL